MTSQRAQPAHFQNGQGGNEVAIIRQIDDWFSERGYKRTGANEAYFHRPIGDTYEFTLNAVKGHSPDGDHLRLQLSYELRISRLAKLDQTVKQGTGRKVPLKDCGWVAHSPYEYLKVPDHYWWIKQPALVEKDRVGPHWEKLLHSLDVDLRKLTEHVPHFSKLQELIENNDEWEWMDSHYSPAYIMALNGNIDGAILHIENFDPQIDDHPYRRHNPHSVDENRNTIEALSNFAL
jgi:hypothetical protein